MIRGCDKTVAILIQLDTQKDANDKNEANTHIHILRHTRVRTCIANVFIKTEMACTRHEKKRMKDMNSITSA